MSRVRTRNTRPELAVRSVLHHAGFRYRLHDGRLPGTPDIVLPRHRLAIFVHGCFWHGHAGCPRGRLPATNVDFWAEKITRNVDRDRRAVAATEALGWRTLTIWECETRAGPDIASRLAEALEMRDRPIRSHAEIPRTVEHHADRGRRPRR